MGKIIWKTKTEIDQERGRAENTPTEQQILWQTITDLQLDLMLTNQALTDAQIELEMMKGV